MITVPLGLSDYDRRVAKNARILLRNRFFEQNPTLNPEGAAMIARPGLMRWRTVGTGPIRGIFSQPGTFGEALFVVSGNKWYKVLPDGTSTLLFTGIAGGADAVVMAGTAEIGVTPPYMFIADGTTLRVYDGATVATVATPGSVGVIGLGYVASHVVVVPAQGEGINGRFYWIEPGEITIDPLNFATAERAADGLTGVVVFGDQFWLPGSATTEVWYFTGDTTTPVLRQQGIVFDRGSWQGTGVQVKDSMIIVSADGGVFDVSGGIEKVSTPDIEERIRKAIKEQVA